MWRTLSSYDITYVSSRVMNHFVGPFFLCNAQWEIIALIFSYWGQNTLVVLPKILFKFAILAADCKNAIKACCTVRNNCLNFLLLRPKHTGSFAQNSVQIDLILRCRLLRCSNSGVCEICNATNGCCTVGDNYLNFLIMRPLGVLPKSSFKLT